MDHFVQTNNIRPHCVEHPGGTPHPVVLSNLLSHGRYEHVASNHITMLYGEGAKQIVAIIQSFVTEENHAFC